ncbi:glycosyltransferase family 2 protein [Streptoverticillium reticulum]|uniref:glycosyltransferase family 2 protein n=1 Tax=Streptoverticillium reticulum TaxID=1433415 RepID=UPI0039BFA2EF
MNTQPPAPAQTPDITIIMAVYNAMPYLSECLQSIVTQTLGMEKIEVIAVDDGSTDNSGTELDRYADRYPQVRVIHQTNSGGPSQPRNRALDLARGRYTFVVDADDYLGRESLQRLVAMADEQHSDIVLAKLVGLGRAVSDKAHRHAPRADLYTSEVYRTLHSAKLMRRSMLEREHIRYPEDLWFGEDQLFVTAAYLAARTISVVGDYDCYYLRLREDGGNITSRRKNADETVQHIERVMTMIADRVTDPTGRRRLLGRHFRALIDKAIVPAVRQQTTDPDYSHDVLKRCRTLCETHYTPDITQELSQLARIRLHAFQHRKDHALTTLAHYNPRHHHPDTLVDQGRMYRRYPLFRDPGAGLPDHLYDITDTLRTPHRLDHIQWRSTSTLRLTGHAYIDTLETRHMATEITLLNRQTQQEHRIPAATRATPHLATPEGTRHPDHSLAGFTADIDLRTLDAGSPITHGTWDLFLDVRAEGVLRTVRFGRFQEDGLDTLARRPQVIVPADEDGLELTVSVFYTHGWNNLSLEVAQRRPLPAPADTA